MSGYTLSARAAAVEKRWSRPAERKDITFAPSRMPAGAQDEDNFRTNKITVAEHNDRGGGVLGLATTWACVNFIAGTIAGVSQSVENTFGNTSTSALGTVRSLDAGDALKTGVAGGLSKSSDKLTDFYLDLARQAGPIVEVGAAKDVVVVIQEGLALEIKPTTALKF